MRPMKLPYLRTRKYTNKAGETWIGYYYEPPRGSAGEPGVKPKPVSLGSHLVKANAAATPPVEVLQAYGKAVGRIVALPPSQRTCQAIYNAWHDWAEREVRENRLAQRSLEDYEDHWGMLKPVFAGGMIDAVTQPVLLEYFDKRASKDRGKREVAFMGLLCAWAHARGRRALPSPVDRGLRMQLKVTKRPKAPPVTDEAYWVVWHCGDQLVRDTLDLAYQLSTRPAEVLGVPMPPADATEIEAFMPKTRNSGRSSKLAPITPKIREICDRRRKLQPHSLYVLFDQHGQQLRPTGAIRSRLYKARDLAKKVCESAGIKWVDFTLQQLRPTAITKVDKMHGREEARKSAGHRTQRQTADYVRHGAEVVTTASLPAPNIELQARVEKILATLGQSKE